MLRRYFARFEIGTGEDSITSWATAMASRTNWKNSAGGRGSVLAPQRFYISSGNPSVVMHYFASQIACEPREVSQGMQSELPGLARIRAVCVPKG